MNTNISDKDIESLKAGVNGVHTVLTEKQKTGFLELYLACKSYCNKFERIARLHEIKATEMLVNVESKRIGKRKQNRKEVI